MTKKEIMKDMDRYAQLVISVMPLMDHGYKVAALIHQLKLGYDLADDYDDSDAPFLQQANKEITAHIKDYMMRNPAEVNV